MKNTTNTSVNTERSGRLKEIPSVADIDLRDYFAAKAMQGYLASETENNSVSFQSYAIDAYRMADAMLAARGAA